MTYQNSKMLYALPAQLDIELSNKVNMLCGLKDGIKRF